jgi:hypothetical protein
LLRGEDYCLVKGLAAGLWVPEGQCKLFKIDKKDITEMTTTNPIRGSDECESREQEITGITGPRRRIASLAGRLLARQWLRQRGIASPGEMDVAAEPAKTSKRRKQPS